MGFEVLADRASRSLTAEPRAFLRWAGSKRYLLPQIVQHIPRQFRTYFEPFLGGGSLYFALQPEAAALSDLEPELINAFVAVRDSVEEILDRLSQWPVDAETYYKLRSDKSGGSTDRAARFIYLNRTCWNGLYRVNSKGEFNVPFGRPGTTSLVDPANLRACSAELRRSAKQLTAISYVDAVKSAGPGDFVFLDPPYVTGHNNNGFVDYNRRLFDWADQRTLAGEAIRLARQGTHVMVANAHHVDVIDLYGKEFEVVDLHRHSSLAATTRFRRPVTEALLLSGSMT